MMPMARPRYQLISTISAVLSKNSYGEVGALNVVRDCGLRDSDRQLKAIRDVNLCRRG